MRIVLLAAALAGLCGCTTIKPYEKEYLLHPLMEDEAQVSLSPGLMAAASASFEKLASGAPGSGGASSCPTCGG
jgi:hypothetical protein